MKSVAPGSEPKGYRVVIMIARDLGEETFKHDGVLGDMISWCEAEETNLAGQICYSLAPPPQRSERREYTLRFVFSDLRDATHFKLRWHG